MATHKSHFLVLSSGIAGLVFALRVAEARRRAVRKFPDAERLWFTPELLEQASAHLGRCLMVAVGADRCDDDAVVGQ